MIVVKPGVYMNSSGLVVRKIPQYLNISISQYLDNLYVIHDDLDIKLGEYKMQFGKGPAGHKGVESVVKELGTKDFWRARIGIENRKAGSELEGEDYVLKKFNKKEKEVLDEVIEKVVRELDEEKI